MVAANGGSTSYYAKLTADIDFEREVNAHLPIGLTKGNKFKGVFDGQGHRIKNMIIYRPQDEAQGFFGYLQGNSPCTVKNLIIDKTCSVIALTKAAGLAGSCQNTSSTITIENCVNEANVTVSGQDAAGIIGGQNDTNPKFVIRNCVNTGNITSTNASPYAGALGCYLGNSSNTIENFINTGLITGHEGGNIGRMMGTVKGIVDVSETGDKTQGVVEELSSADITSGVLTYYMNNVAGKEVFFQTLGEDGYPLPFNTSKSVKQISISDAGYATYVAEGNVQFPSPIEAFAVVSTENNYASLSAITEAAAGDPVLVKSAEGKYCYNPAETATSPTNNLLQAATKAVVADGTQYCLANNEQGVGFYKVETGSSISAGKAYLVISGSDVKEFYPFSFDEEETDSINEELRMKNAEGVASDMRERSGNEESSEGVVYDLSGRRMLNGLKKSVYIQNGKKTVK